MKCDRRPWCRGHQPFLLATTWWIQSFYVYMHQTLGTWISASPRTPCNSSVMHQHNNLSNKALVTNISDVTLMALVNILFIFFYAWTKIVLLFQIVVLCWAKCFWTLKRILKNYLYLSKCSIECPWLIFTFF